MPRRKPRIVVVGSVNTDLIVRMPRLPRPGETVIGGTFDLAAGGKGANQAIAAARAGADVALVGRIGEDDFGRRSLAGFARDGIDTRFVSVDRKAASGVAFIVVDRRGQNSIAVASGANARLSPADVRAARSAIVAADLLLLQLEVPLPTVRAAIEIAFKAGVRILLNPAPARPLDGTLLRRVSVLTPNEPEAAALAGIPVRFGRGAAQASGILRRKGAAAVAVTLGGRGAYFDDGSASGFIPGFRVEAVDATAAGDVFSGALAVALADGRSFGESARFANAAAAISVTRPGAQPSAPKRSEIEALLRNERRRP
jgi:ribokinase